jgi:predicted methyltransferase
MKLLLSAAFTIFPLLFGALCTQAQERYDGSKLLAHPTRLSSDLKADDSRKPLEFLAFTKVKAGDQVLDLATGGGYSAQLLALASQPGGHVWAQNEKPSQALTTRLAEHPQVYFEAIIKTFENPIPDNSPPLDLVSIVLSYHDLAFMPFDRGLMNQRIFKALKSGGHYVVIDHAAKSGTGLRDIKTIHRIDEQTVLNEILAAGFQLEAESGEWRNPKDPRAEMFSKMTQPDDRFALRFVKP